MQKTPQGKISGKGRLGALARMSSLLVMIALTITYLPNWLNDSASLQGPAAHAREKADAEIQLRFEQGVAMLNAKQYDYALTSFHRVLQLAPNLPEAHVNMGFALLGLKRYAIARDFFESAIELRKDQMNAYYGLSEALSGMNDIPGALGAMRTYAHRSPPDDPYRRRADAAIWELESKLAEERKKSASDNNPDAKQGGSTQKDSAKTP